MITVRHSKALGNPSSGDEDKVYGGDWNDVHVVEGLGSAAESAVADFAPAVHTHDYAATGHDHDKKKRKRRT